ncbi:hypothetical protein [Actinomadura latina]|uniref:Uncharacterized protein n=1 Tax=Actinomadura latina TaxID=163603 RepID=A0A846Z144_9ACTN|nr:hypothetical protein [Actinomadura latina]NKZ04524.1 hypothetical protein [Actinomadura latina]
MPDPLLTEIGWAGSALRLAGRFTPGVPVPEIELLLHEHGDGEQLRVPVTADTRDGVVIFEAEVDVASIVGGRHLPGRLWDVNLAIGAPPSHSVVPLGHVPGLDASPQRRFLPDSATVTAYFGTDGGFKIDVGGRSHSAGSVRADGTSWNERRAEIIVTGHVDLREISMPISGTLLLSQPPSDRRFEVIAMLEEHPGRLCYTAAVPVTRAFIDDPLPRGIWEVSLCLGFSGMHREMRLLAPDEPVDVQVWRRLRHVRVTSSAAPDPLTITVGHA